MTEENPIYTAVFGDGSFQKISLGNIINKGGAAGKIYEVVEHPNFVAKIFHSLAKSNTNREKLQAMLQNRPSFAPAQKNGKEVLMSDGEKYIQIAWPEAILENDNGFCVGYLMPRIDLSLAASLDHFLQKATRQKLNLPENYDYRVRIACNLSAMVAALHEKGHYIVDLKPSNVYVYKESMLVSILDCDGFSIKGEKNRYPAEFVSEEYIYPEGMNQDCEEMGEEQDKFALAVIIFKLLNNGIHPFSGTPRKTNHSPLTIQDRIAQNHYAYGAWADLYQAPHPYSIHDFFTKETLELFDRAFIKGQKRPTAQEWEKHLRKLISTLKPCKKNHMHFYFTPKGCGLCMVEEKFKSTLKDVEKQTQNPKTIRGVSIDNLAPEKIASQKRQQMQRLKKLNIISLACITIYLLFWSLLYPITAPFAKQISNMGFGIQMLVITFLMSFIYKALKKFSPRIPVLNNQAITTILFIYPLLCSMICLCAINNPPVEIILLSE
ncbi:MAG: hypothetical protein J6T72_04865 [Alphaproteobacteria bacterium]|nr:hypothetical protein [Alphaproteobacteria bacterium]